MVDTASSPAADASARQISPHHYALLMMMGILWGLALSLAKIGVEAGGHPVGMGLWQVCTSSSLMFVLMMLRSKRLPMRADIARFGLVCGGFGVAFPAIALFWCALYLPAGVLAIAFASMPLFTYSLSVLLRIERALGQHHPGRESRLG